ncbi:MAG: DNA polymerase III subunit alpha [Rhodospirillaceae bacterium]|nr:DNA polymerase III subunit alpha [Rhodospirillaceae bacterium]
MTHADFVHLRVHSAYSLSEGALKIPDIATLCKANRMPAVAITDTNNLFGALEFSQTCARAGVQPIVGCQLAVAFEASNPNRLQRDAFDRLVLLAQNETGYRNLLSLTSRAFLAVEAGAAPHVPGDAVAAHAEGLIALTGAHGPLGRFLAAGQDDAAEAACARLKAIFGDRLYIEIARQGVRDDTAIEPKLLALADATNLPLVATNEAFFAEEGMFAAHDALLCIAGGTSVNEPDRRRLTPEFRFKTAQEMRAQFADLPEALDNTLAIAERCAVMAETRAPILPHFVSEAGRSEADELRHRATEGLEERLAGHVVDAGASEAEREAAARPYRARLETELGIIESMGYPGYFLIVADFIQWAKGEGIPVGPGRGSGAGSVVAWALTITDLDPLRWGLLFERFLNPERVSMPDFDIDFCQERRDEVIRYVQQKYGADRVAQIITFGKLQARAVLRDVGRVLEMPYGQVDRLCKLVPNNPANPVTLQEAIEIEPQLQEQRRQDESVARLIDIALQLEGLYRHASTHAAGVVIGDRPLEELIPLYRDPRSDMPVSQFNMKDVEKAGLVKFDFLGLKTLSVLQTAVDLLRARGIEIDLERLPLDDAGTYEMISRADTTGVFQLESSGMRDVLRRLKPDRFEDIIAVVALYRPGPMENIPSYINRKHGVEAVAYDHPKLEPVLKETFGIPIYQEQVQQMARDLAGYTLATADLLRRAMGKKIKAEMDAQRETFVNGALANDVARSDATRIFELVAKFAGYGFNKSHAAAYALVAYQTAYLKANHPVEFYAASMSFDMGNADRIANFRRELQHEGIDLLPPDVNRSDVAFAVEDGAVRYALAALKNVGAAAMESLVRERAAEGRFRDVGDLADRLGTGVVNKRQMEHLVKAGALDSLNPNRRQLFEGVDAIARLAAVAADDRSSNQVNLFGDDPAAAGAALRLPDVPDRPLTDRLRHEFEAVGVYLSAHPLDSYARSLEKMEVVSYGRLVERAQAGEPPSVARLAGTVIGRKERRNAKGNRFAFVQLSDASGRAATAPWTWSCRGANARPKSASARRSRPPRRSTRRSSRSPASCMWRRCRAGRARSGRRGYSDAIHPCRRPCRRPARRAAPGRRNRLTGRYRTLYEQMSIRPARPRGQPMWAI